MGSHSDSFIGLQLRWEPPLDTGGCTPPDDVRAVLEEVRCLPSPLTLTGLETTGLGGEVEVTSTTK